MPALMDVASRIGIPNTDIAARKGEDEGLCSWKLTGMTRRNLADSGGRLR